MSVIHRQIRQDMQKLIDQLSTHDLPAVKAVDQVWEDLNQLQLQYQIEIAHLRFQDETDQLNETITIKNRGTLIADLSGWTIEAGSPHQIYTFPEHSLLHPHQQFVVHTSGEHTHSFQFHHPIWNNRGDLATLKNHQGDVVCYWAYGQHAHSDVVISRIKADGHEGRGEGDEFIEIVNISEHIVDLSDWQVTSVRNQTTFTFPPGSKLRPGASLKIFTDKTTLAENEYSFNSHRALWNNQGGGAELIDYLGCMVSVYQY
ncbi:Intermediate filament tail domain protein [Vibrio aerogenes CECT 7868]|uniref:Intermediate filament tail domain protein n=1 Tax=Vibrio aerogenes CECT 7868 TaxID=1216006 RepID=A0A1M5VLS6_9VIBR|nr:lamin tail domain-containing protein [Vibrio aerogenes]SHH76128.1 Intermediate filament tail domain protein [Vibrio aerogenes CECT 7868]